MNLPEIIYTIEKRIGDDPNCLILWKQMEYDDSQGIKSDQFTLL